MSPREKKLLIFFVTAIFLVVNLFGVQWVLEKRNAVQVEGAKHAEIVEFANSAAAAQEAFIQEIDWLEDNVPEPKEGQMVQTRLQEFATNEANNAGLTIVKPEVYDNDESGLYFGRARVDMTVNGNEAALYRWLVRLHSPRDFRAITALRLSPNRADDTLIDAKVQIEQWFVQSIAEVSE